jgi:hypothetical protein
LRWTASSICLSSFERLTRFNLLGVSTVLVKHDLLSKAGPFDPAMDPAARW